MSNDFKKILNYLDKEAIEEILEEYEFPKSGKKEKLLEIILKNATLFEYGVKMLLAESYKGEIQDMCDDLDIDSNSNVSELRQKILDKVTKNINNRDIKNKIKFLNFAYDKESLVIALESHNIPKTGKKEKVVETIARNDSMMEIVMKDYKLSYKENFEAMCKHLKINFEGNKEKLLQRINDYVFKTETRKHIKNKSEQRTTKLIKNTAKRDGKNSQGNRRRGWTVDEKYEVRNRQDGKCYVCKKHPPGWHYHHIDGDNSNNSMDNCHGLCPNCHYFELK